MVMKYVDYYRHCGIRRAMQMVAPTLLPMQQLTLPRESVLHYLPEGASVGIAADDYVLHQVAGPIYVEHILELGDKRGNPRSSMVTLSKIIRDYHRKYRQLRQLHDLERGLGDKRSLIVENYAILPQLYRYPPNIYRPYNKWYNIQATFWKRVAAIAAQSDRAQFVECRLPTMLPSKNALLKGTGQVTTKFLSLFPEQASLFILELWKWLGPQRSTSILATVPITALDKLNLIWIESGRFFVINLGMLNHWRQPTPEEIADGAVAGKGIPATSLQNRFLRLLMFLHESRTAAGGEAKAIEEGEAVETTPEEHGDRVVEQSATIEIPLDGDDETLILEPGLDWSKLPLDAVEETEANNAKIDALIERDLEALDHLYRERELLDLDELTFDPDEALTDPGMLDIPALKDITLKEGVMAKAGQLADMGLLSAAEYRRFTALSEAYTKLPDPYGEKASLVEALEVDLKDLTVTSQKLAPTIRGVVDESMLYSTLAEYDSKYVKHGMRKDMGNMVLAVQKAGIAVTGYQVKEHRDAMNHYDAHSIQLTPVRGKPSTIHFRIPRVAEDGTFVDNGIKYRMSKQRADVPIRKIASDTVALTSYYAKVFISRSEKKVANYAGWITNQLAARGTDPADNTITDMMLADVYDANQRVPRMYSILAKRFRSFTAGEARFFLDYDVRHSLVASDVLKAVEVRGAVLCGTWGKDKSPIVIGPDNVFYKVVKEKNEWDLQVLGAAEELFDLESAKAPKEVAEIKIFSKLIPVGIFLAYHLGFEGLLALLNVQPTRRVQQGEHVKLSSDEYVITFEDEKWVFLRGMDTAQVILQGVATWNEALANYPAHLFDKKTVYFNIMDRMGLGIRYLREMDLLVDMFIDPITREILEKQKQPITFVGLVLKACELLLTDWSPDETDAEYQRFRGYERMSGAVYQELVRAIRVQRARGTSNAPVDISPYAIWTAISQDTSKRLVEESNPVHELKSQEEVTFAGTGGRSGRSMVGRTRVFHDNDLGIISEATKDSSAVAITTSMTANPLLTDVRGMSSRYHPKETGPSSLISTSALLAPCADRDDARRTNFISIQNSSTTYCKHQRAAPLRTGYERVVAHRTSDLFAYTAKQDGKVTKVSKGAVEVTYKDGTVRSVELGRRFGSVAGLTIPHEIATSLKVGDKVHHGDIVAYNSHFFEIDPLDPTQALYKSGVLMTTALLESPETLEDSSVLSVRAAKLLETQITKVRDIVVAFDQAIHGLIEPGTTVGVDSILCTIEDPITADHRMFDESSLDTLKLIAANNPKAKVAGIVERVEIFYHGDLDDLSPTLQELAHTSDLERKRRARELHETFASGRVDDSMRIDGNPLLANHAVIRLYITTDVPAGVGDKGVFGNQLKTIFGRVMVGRNVTEDGRELDAFFPYSSVSNRIVSSPELMGTTNSLLKVISRKAADIYFGSK